MISEICTGISLADYGVRMAKKMRNAKYIFNGLKPSVKIAVFGESGSGKSSFISAVIGRDHDGNSTRFINEIKHRLPSGRRILFIDIPGQESYRNLRQEVKTQIMNGKIDGIINVVCAGYNESSASQIKMFRNHDTEEVDPSFIRDNYKRELDRLSEWVPDIYAKSRIKWILTLVNKADIWKEKEEETMAYYQNGDYSKHFNGIERFCAIHTLPYCSVIQPFGDRPMVLCLSETDKKKLHIHLMNSLGQFIENG